jgi:hypothetical protein
MFEEKNDSIYDEEVHDIIFDDNYDIVYDYVKTEEIDKVKKDSNYLFKYISYILSILLIVLLLVILFFLYYNNKIDL